jgi:hypothetical protein
MWISRTREKILKLFFDTPELIIHQRGIARRTGIVPQNVHKYLKEFVEKGLLIRQEIPHLTLFKINPGHDGLIKIFEWFELHRREEFIDQNERIGRLLNRYAEDLVRKSQRKIQMVLILRLNPNEKLVEGSPVNVITTTSTAVDQTEIHRIYHDVAKKTSLLIKASPSNIFLPAFIKDLEENAEFYDLIRAKRIVLYNEYLFWRLIREARFKR